MPDVPDAAKPALSLRASVGEIRQVAAQRWAAQGFHANGHVDHATLTSRRWQIPPARTAPLNLLVERGTLSPHGRTSVLRLAWTLADLRGSTTPSAHDIQTAIHLRTGAGQ